MKAGLEAAAAAIAALAAAALAGAKEVVQLGTDYQQATNQLSAQTGATGQELEELGGIAQEVYRNNFGDSISDVNEALATTRTNTGLMGDELRKATESGYLLRDTFGMDFSESSRAASALMNKFGISAQQAYNLIAVGAQNGANRNGDLLDVLSEYAPKYAEMGLTADDMMQTLIAGCGERRFPDRQSGRRGQGIFDPCDRRQRHDQGSLRGVGPERIRRKRGIGRGRAAGARRLPASGERAASRGRPAGTQPAGRGAVRHAIRGLGRTGASDPCQHRGGRRPVHRCAVADQ